MAIQAGWARARVHCQKVTLYSIGLLNDDRKKDDEQENCAKQQRLKGRNWGTKISREMGESVSRRFFKAQSARLRTESHSLGYKWRHKTSGYLSCHCVCLPHTCLGLSNGCVLSMFFLRLLKSGPVFDRVGVSGFIDRNRPKTALTQAYHSWKQSTACQSILFSNLGKIRPVSNCNVRSVEPVNSTAISNVDSCEWHRSIVFFF